MRPLCSRPTERSAKITSVRNAAAGGADIQEWRRAVFSTWPSAHNASSSRRCGVARDLAERASARWLTECAWGWSDHVDHERTVAWIAARRQRATKPMTSAIPELGFVGVSVQRTGGRVTAGEATETLASMVAALGARHVLLADDQAAREFPKWCSSASRTTDAHLLELATAHEAKLATLDCPEHSMLTARPADGPLWRLDTVCPPPP